MGTINSLAHGTSKRVSNLEKRTLKGDWYMMHVNDKQDLNSNPMN